MIDISPPAADLSGGINFFLTFFLLDVPYIYEGSSRRIVSCKLGRPYSTGRPTKRSERPRDDAPEARVKTYYVEPTLQVCLGTGQDGQSRNSVPRCLEPGPLAV